MIQPPLLRQPASRKSTSNTRKKSGTQSSLGSIVTLNRWQLGQTWPLLIVTGMGLLIAVILVGAIPLYGRVANSAGLRHALEAEPQNQYITVNSASQNFIGNPIPSTQTQITQVIQSDLGAAASSNPAISVQISAIPFSQALSVQIIGTNVSQAKSHVKLLKGRLPTASSGNVLEFDTTNDGLHYLDMQVGQSILLNYQLINPMNNRLIIKKLQFRLVGIIAQTNVNDIFWHGETFLQQTSFTGLTESIETPIMVSNTELINTLSTISANALENFEFNTPAEIFWYYSLELSHLDADHLPALTNGMNQVLTTLSQYPQDPPFIENTVSFGPLSVLEDYSARETVSAIPILCLTFLISALVLFFVILLTDVLVERQMAGITILRSRGATARQVFGSLMGQSIGLGIIAFVAGPLLAILLVALITRFTLTASERMSLALLTDNPLATAQGLTERDLLVIGIAILGMAVSIWRIMRGNILSLRRESTRSTQQPFWKRFRLDFLAAATALVGFGFSLYIENGGVLDLRTRTLVLPLTTTVGFLFLLVSGLLLFLRVFPNILQWGEQLASRRRGAAPLLALAQMARSPLHALRLTLLFSLAVALTLFTLLFQATQTQRLVDLTTYQIGGDFSGQIPQVLQDNDWGSLKSYFSGLKGIRSETLGYAETVSGGNGGAITISLEAVDSSTYAQTFNWSSQYSSQSPAALMSTLQSRQASAEQHNIIPAIIDDTAAQSLGVGIGQQFTLSDFHGPMDFVVTAIVHYIPTIYDTSSGTENDPTIPQGGVLVDFQTYSDIALAVNENGVSASNVWLRSDNDPADIAAARSGLFSGTYTLVSGEDRRAQTASLTSDPLYAAIIGVLALGTALALLLGIGGNLLISWLSASKRRTSFAILRALGCSPGQIVGVLLWEQGLIYGVGLLLGLVLGLVLSLIILPAFVFSPVSETAIGGAEVFYLAQSVPAVQLVVPVVAILAMLLGVVALCALALGIMVRVVARPQLNQQLRLSED